MSRDPKYDVLFEPVRIGPKVLKNRFYQVPHCTGFGTDRPGAQARFRATKAEGGWAAVCTELASIHPETDRAPRPVVRIWDDDDARNLALMCEEALELVRLADPLVDLWDVNIGSMADVAIDVGPSRVYDEGWQLPWTGRVREATAKPIVGVGRLTSPDRMVEIVRSGVWDLIGAARPSISDPFLPRKIEEGRLDEIRECIGCNICTSRSVWAGHLACTQNPTAGEEFRRGWHPERFERAANADRDVLVVGAGAAGGECASVLGKRGMRRVHLVEAAPEIGGYAGLVSRLPGLGQWARVVNWRKIQLAKLGNVEVITGVGLDATEIREYGAEIVVVATGAHW